MIQRMGVYHPSVIFQSKRTKAAQQPGTASPKSSGDPVEPSSQENPRPEGVGGILYDAVQFLRKVQDGVASIHDKTKSLQSISEESLDFKLSDQDRKKINKRFQATKADIDQFARTTAVDGDTVFSGKYSNKARPVKAGSTDEETINLRISSYTAEGLKIDRLRIDSFPMAKKAFEFLSRTNVEIDETAKSLQDRIDALAYKLNILQKNDENTGKQNRSQSIDTALQNADSGKLSVLRAQQETAAEAKGRTFGLLVNLKV